MATRKKILLPRSSIPGRAPTLNEIDFGEIAINTHDGKAYIKRDRDGEFSIQSIGGEETDNVYYVSKSGNLGNDGKSLGNAFATLDSAVATVYTKQSFKFDSTTCQRDLHLIMDGVRYDMALGTNYGAITAGQSYKRGNAIKVTSEQLYQTRRSINEERLGMVSVPTVKTNTTAKTRVQSGFDEIIEILIGGEASALEYETPIIQADSPTNESTASAQAIISNKESIQDAVLDYINDPTNNFLTGSYDATVCSRDVGLIVNAVARDLLLGTDYNTTTAGWAYNRASSAYVLSDQKDATVAAINFAKKYITDLAGVTSDTDVENLFKNVTDVIEAVQTVYPAITYPTTSGSTYQVGDRVTAATALQTDRQTLIDGTISFIAGQYPGLGYDETKCRRDVGYILDGLTHDIKYGGNVGTRINALAYFSNGANQLGSGVNSLGESETDASVDAYTDLKLRINAVVPVSQQSPLGSLVDEIIGVLNAGNTSGLSAEIEIDTGGLTTTEFDAIQAAVVGAQNATIDYVNEYFATELGGYDAGKCARDVGLILDAVSRDIIIGGTTDYWSKTAANSYLRANSAYVLSDQKQATIEAVTFARDLTKDLAGVTSDARVDTLFEYVIDVLDGTTTSPWTSYAYEINGTYASSGGRQAQRDSILAGRASLISDVSGYIDVNYPGFAFDQTACDRDTGFIIDAIIADLTYGGNTATRQAALAYFVGTKNQLGANETSITVESYGYLGTQIKILANVVEDSRIDDLLAIITDTITAGNTDGVPAEDEIETGGLTTTEFDAIQTNKTIIQNDVIDYVNDQNIVNNFDQHKCERDTGLIIDAIALDLQNNTNYNSITAGLAYQRGNAQKVQDDQKLYTIQSIEYLRDQINASGINSTSQTFVTARIKEITELLNETGVYGQTDGDLVFTGSGSEDADKRNAANALIANRRVIKNRVITWIQENYDSLEYDQEKCARDVGYIVDAITHDILFDGTYATDTSARSYWVGTDLNIENTATQYESLDGDADVWTNQLGSEEISATAAAYEELKTIVNSYIATTAEETRVNTLMDVIIASINAADGSGITVTLPAITGESATFYNNRSVLQEQVVFYANSIFPTYSYDQATCRRDVGYILDALTYDIMYGGNSATSIAMRSYFSIFSNGYADRLGPSEFAATIAAYGQLKTIIATYVVSISNQTRINNLLDIIINAIQQSSVGSFQIGDFFATSNYVSGPIYQYNYPTGLAVGFDTLTFPNLTSLGIELTYPTLYNSWAEFNQGTSIRQTIIRQSAATANNQGTDTTIFLKSGDYTVNNPIKLPPKTSIIGDALRATTIRPRNVDSDIFWVDNGCYVKEITFRDHQNGAACVAFDPRNDVNTGPFITQSPYVQNCTSLTTSGIGMKIDGSKVSGLRSMVLDAFTQFNADGIGVLMQNRAYAQLVSCFTISTSTSIKAESGSQCSLTNSNSSFGDFGLVATGGSESIYNGTLHATYNQNDDVIRVNGIVNTDAANYSLNIGDFKKPNYNDAIKFADDNYYYTVLDVSEEVTQDWGTSNNTNESTLINPSPVSNEEFGLVTKMSRDDAYMFVSAPGTGSATGEVEVYTRDLTEWTHQAQIKPSGTVENPLHSNTVSGRRFGSSIASNKDGSLLAVGAGADLNGDTLQQGSVYVYKRTGSSWAFDIILQRPVVAGQSFQLAFEEKNISMSEDGNWLAVSSQLTNGSDTRGRVFLYQRGSVELDGTGSDQGIEASSLSSSGDYWTLMQTLVCPASSAGIEDAAVTLSTSDGADLIVAWTGQINTAYYYARNIFNQYGLIQTIVPQSNIAVNRNPSITIATNADYFVYGDGNSPFGYYKNSFTDSAEGSLNAAKQSITTFDVSTVAPHITTTDPDVDFTKYFSSGVNLKSDAWSAAGNKTIQSLTANTITFTNNIALSNTTVTDEEIYTDAAGAVELFYFNEGTWGTQEIVTHGDKQGVVSSNEDNGPMLADARRLGTAVDISSDGLLAVAGEIGASSSTATGKAQTWVIERAASNWSNVSKLIPQDEQSVSAGDANDDRFGTSVALGAKGDYIAVSATGRVKDIDGSPALDGGTVFNYYSILDETGSYNLTIAPGLNRSLEEDQTVNFHQRSLISASSHTFEFVGSGTNMFAAIPQNGGIPIKQNEVVFDSAEAAEPNFGLVYFTATDELGDFRIGGDLTINRESGTITGTTFDRSLFAVLTPYILALEG